LAGVIAINELRVTVPDFKWAMKFFRTIENTHPTQLALITYDGRFMAVEGQAIVIHTDGE